MRKVIFVQSRIPTDKQELIQLSSRWNQYSQALAARGNLNGIGIFSISPLSSLQKGLLLSAGIYDVCDGTFKVNYFSRFRNLYKLIKSSRERCILICGDTHLSFLSSQLMKILLVNKIGIQTQFHGDTYSFQIHDGLKTRLLKIISRLAARYSDSIRIVSNFQKKEISKFVVSSKEIFVLAPIPLDYAKISKEKHSRTIDVAFIGRLHPERGIDILIKVISQLMLLRENIQIIIVGDGPMRTLIEEQFAASIKNGLIALKGYVGASEIADLLSRSKVLLSTAPTEGYGLTLREGVLNGAMVVARRSQGAEETYSLFPNRVRLFEDEKDAVRLVLESLDTDDQFDTSAFIEAQQSKEIDSTNALISSWLSI